MADNHLINLMRTYWWNRVQLFGLISVTTATAVVIVVNVPVWYLAIWFAYLLGVFFLYMVGHSTDNWGPFIVVFCVGGVTFVLAAPTWTLRGLALLTVLVHVLLTGTAWGTASLEAYERVEKHLSTRQLDERYLKLIVQDSYCWRRGVLMSLCKRLGRREGRRLVQELS
mgnify:CR=1 FL=1